MLPLQWAVLYALVIWQHIQSLTLCLAVQANASRYFLLDQTKTLRQNLAGKTVIEYPTFLVVLPSELPSYAVVAMALPPRPPSAPHPSEGNGPYCHCGGKVTR